MRGAVAVNCLSPIAFPAGVEIVAAKGTSTPDNASPLNQTAVCEARASRQHCSRPTVCHRVVSTASTKALPVTRPKQHLISSPHCRRLPGSGALLVFVADQHPCSAAFAASVQKAGGKTLTIISYQSDSSVIDRPLGAFVVPVAAKYHQCSRPEYPIWWEGRS